MTRNHASHDHPDAATPTPAPAAALPARRKLAYDRIALVLAVLALVTLIGVALLATLAWRDGEQLSAAHETLAQRLAAAETLQRDAAARTQQHDETLQGRLAAVDAQLAELHSQQQALASQFQTLSQLGEDRILAELEQALSLAAQQLQLAGNVEAALGTLQAAEARLARHAQPGLLPLRKAVARDIERLKALPVVDLPGMAMKLESLISAVPALPLAFTHLPPDPAVTSSSTPTSEPTSAPKQTTGGTVQPSAPAATPDAVPPAPTFVDALRAWGSDLWHELRQLVRIERLDRSDPGLLAPQEAFFLRENLKLRLLTARLALFARDGRSLRDDIEQARTWLATYYDGSVPAVQRAQATLTGLARQASQAAAHAPPDLNETLAALRNIKPARPGGR